MDDPPLLVRLPAPGACTSDELLDLFLGAVKARGLALYPAQEEALLELYSGAHVILNTPTGSGKSLVAEALHFLSMGTGGRSFYTCPIKALVNEKFFALCEAFGPKNVGLMTGDAAVNRDAPIVCCTAEILANMALREGNALDAAQVVMDEFHYYADPERGTAWQLPLLILSKTQFLLMSATLGPTEHFERALEDLTGQKAVTVRSATRPVPLDFQYKESLLHESIPELCQKGQVPVYVVCFTQRNAATEAQNLMSIDFSTKEEKRRIAEALSSVKFDSPYGKELSRFLKHGVGLHHAGLLPKYRRAVERLAQAGHLKVICGTDTLGVGINVPIRTVLFTALCKYDGTKTALLSVRDFKQIAGRAGRKGFDESGTVVVQAPPHVVENLRMEQRAASDPVKRKKIVKKKPPEHGYVHWDKTTFDRLISGEPEPLVSRFSVSHGMILNLFSRTNTGCTSLLRLIRASHERPHAQKVLAKTAQAMVRSLCEGEVVEFRDGLPVVHASLQDDFSMNQSLSLYLLEAIRALDKESPMYALDLLTLVESILENPDVVLQKQLDKKKSERVAELKALGIPYDERMAELETIEIDKPNAEFIYETFNLFAKHHPWVGENIRPKSIARDMVEKYLSFHETVREYGLERSEGVLLRYLSDVYKTLSQTVPDPAKDEATRDLELFFGTMIRTADSSLLEEWEGMGVTPTDKTSGPPQRDGMQDRKGLLVLVRNRTFALLRALAKKDYVGAAELSGPEHTPRRLEETLTLYFAEHSVLRTDPEARGRDAYLTQDADGMLLVTQSFLDEDGPTGWALKLHADLAASAREERAVLSLREIVRP